MTKRILIAALAAALGASGLALAQGGPGPGPGGCPCAAPGAGPCPGACPGPGGGRRAGFDPKTVETVTGRVAAVREVQGRRGPGIHVDLESGGAVLDVHLGPKSYLASKKLQLSAGDQLEVKGSKVTLGGQPALVAQSVKKGEVTVTLRDQRGVAAWSRRAAR